MHFRSTGHFANRLSFTPGNRWFRVASLAVASAVSVLNGCGHNDLSQLPVQGSVLQGRIHGGQQPVTDATIQLYAVGTAGDASAATPLLTSVVKTDSTGSFTITSKYTCPTANTQVYLVGTGGNPGLPQGTNNTALAMMAALGNCGSLTPTTYLSVDEVTTVGSIAALYPYMYSYSAIGSGNSDAVQLATAFSTVNQYTNIAQGTAPGPTLPAGYYASSTEINTLGNIVSACINSSGGVAGDGSNCGNLFQLAKPSNAPAPLDTIGAVLDILYNPTRNVSALFSLSPASPPFQPALTSAPSDWTLPILSVPVAPNFSPAGGTYTGSQSVTINEPTSGASVYYTVDGSTPTTSSALYTSPITVSTSETIKAFASINGRTSSSLSIANYTIVSPPAAATPTFSLAAGFYSSAQTVTISTTSSGVPIYYTTDGSTPSAASTLYTGPITVYETETVKAIAIGNGSTYLNSGIGSVAYTITTYYGTISTIAGNGSATFTGDGGQATSASIYQPYGTAIDAAGNVYIADFSNNRVRKVTPAGVISTVAGNGVAGYSGDGGQAASAALYGPDSVAIDAAGNLYIDDDRNFRIRKVTPGGIISTVAGNGSGAVGSGDGGLATSGSFTYSCAITLDSAGNLYIAECGAGGQRVRKVSTGGIITTVAGNGAAAFTGDGGQATSASINTPEGVALDQSGNLYISDYNNNRIRKVNTSGVISTIAGTGVAGFSGEGSAATAAQVSLPQGLTIDPAGNLYIADSANNRIRKINTSGVITTVVGSGIQGFAGDGGPAGSAYMYRPSDVKFDSAGNMYIADLNNNRIRKVTYSSTGVQVATPAFSVTPGTYNATQYVTISTATTGASIYYTTDGSTPSASSTLYSGALTVSSSTTFKAIAIASGYQDSSVATAAYVITNLSYAGTPAFSPAPGSYATAQTVTIGASPAGAAIYYTTDGTTPTTASTLYTGALTISSSATVKAIAVASGYANSVVGVGGYYINQGTGIITTFAGTGTSGYSGDGGAATSANIYSPTGLVVDGSNNVYFTDTSNNRIRKVNSAGIISTFAGSATYGSAGDGGAATSASLSGPTGLAIDASGNVYIADRGNNRVRKVDTSGIISTVAGNGGSSSGGDGGLATSAGVYYPSGVAIDSAGNLYIAELYGYRIRKVNAAGVISTVAGTGTSGFSGDGTAATSAMLSSPQDVAVDTSGNLYISDSGNARIRKVNPAGIITTYAGTGNSYSSTGDGGLATSASFAPYHISLDSTGALYIADNNNYRVRKITSAGIISTVAGNGSYNYNNLPNGDGGPATSAILTPNGVAVDSIGNVYLSDTSTSRVRKVSYSNAFQAVAPSFSLPTGSYTAAQYLTLSSTTPGASIYYTVNGSTPTTSSTLYLSPIAISTSETVTAITVAPGYSNSAPVAVAYTVTILPVAAAPTFSPAAGTFTSNQNVTLATATSGASIYYTLDGSNPTTASKLYTGFIAVTKSQTINAVTVASGYNPSTVTSAGYYINPAAGIITTIAGTGTSYSFGGDGGLATSASLYSPRGTVMDGAGNLYIADAGNNRIRKVDSSGFITTIAGNGTSGFSGDGGAATSAALYGPQAIALDLNGNLYIADTNNQRVRVINSAGIISTIAGTGTSGFSGDGGAAVNATFNSLQGIAVDRNGNVYVADYNNYRVRKIAPSGIITTVAGTGGYGYNGDGIAATSATLTYPAAVAVDSANNLYIADYYNYRIRKVTASTGFISTIAGNGNYGFAGDGGSATAAAMRMSYPTSVAADSAGNVYFGDSSNYRIRVVNPAGIVSTVAGNGTSAFTGDGTVATGASFTSVFGISTDSAGNLYFADTNNGRIRKVSFGN